MEPIKPPWQAIKEWVADAPLWPCSQQDPPPDLVDIVCRKDAAHAFPTTNPASTGSIDLEDHPIPIPTVSIKLRHGRHPKSIWTTAASGSSNPPDPPGGSVKQPNPRKILAKRLGELASRAMNMIVNSPDPAQFRRSAEHSSFERFRFQHLPPAMPVSISSDSAVFAIAHAAFNSTRPPFSPATPFSPPPVRPPAFSTAFTPKANSWQP
jgi:hypothetical protein